MSRRPSVASSNSPSSSLHGHSTGRNISTSISRELSSQSSRKASISNLSSPEDLDPDELFTKHTVSEIRFVQHRLRADADAKQEELRLMVGERYRDLLQASTSITSIARSSKRVLEALDDTKAAIKLQKAPPLPKANSGRGAQDAHLHALQLLSAHIKLLLDAPEHLWRLIERKKYFTAAWLFLLSGVVHLALRQEQDEETWSSQGIDVLENFPLIQRQWDAVHQFRSQIVHKATQSLREPLVTATDICSAAVTLHLLISKPLTETLEVFLDQRSKSLHALLSYGLDVPTKSPISPTLRRANGHAPQHSPTVVESKKPNVRQIRDAAQAVLDVVASTLRGSRDVFQRVPPSSSLVESVLECIHSDPSTQSSSSSTFSLPAELQLTTESLLMTLPSSTHFMLLPANLRSYKPYVDLSSSSSHVSSHDLDRKVEKWFQDSIDSLKVALDRWFLDLGSVKDVWHTRNTLRKWALLSDSIQPIERTTICLMLDNATRKRIVEIWQSVLVDVDMSFSSSLRQSVASVREGSEVPLDALPLQNLFRAPPLPTSGAPGPVDASFQKYTTSLRRQLLGRTALLDDVLKTLEACARSLQNDMSHVLSNDDTETSALVDDLKERYQPYASTLCSNVLQTLEEMTVSIPDTQQKDIDSLVFVGCIANEFASSSTFVNQLSTAKTVVEDFNNKSRVLHDKILDRWRSYTVNTVVATHFVATPSATTTVSSSRKASAPSWNLTNALLALSFGVQQMGVARGPSQQSCMVEATLQLFIKKLIDGAILPETLASIYDLAFLEQLAAWCEGEVWDVIRRQLADKSVSVRAKLSPNTPIPTPENLASSIADYLARVQVLYRPLLPHTLSRPAAEKTHALMSLGLPTSDQLEFQPAMEISRPRVRRFNMLLVG